MRLIHTVFTAAAVSLVLTSCADNRQVSYNSGGVKQTFTAGSATGGFPLPLYPNAKPAGTVDAQSSHDGDDNHFMMLSSGDPPDKIRDFYAKKLKEDGWSVESNSFAPELTKLDAHRQGLEASIMLAKDNDQTSINLSVSKEDSSGPQAPGQPFTPDKMNPPTD